MKIVLQKKFWKKQGKELKMITVPGAVGPYHITKNDVSESRKL